MKLTSLMIMSIAVTFALLDGSGAWAADSTSYKPIDVPWQRPSSAGTADSAGYANSAGTATSATTANALCPTCTIAGSQVSGTVANATNATNAGYANSSNTSNYAGSSGSASYATNAGYAYSAASALPYCPATPVGSFPGFSDLPSSPSGTAYGSGGCSIDYVICVTGAWVAIIQGCN